LNRSRDIPDQSLQFSEI